MSVRYRGVSAIDTREEEEETKKSSGDKVEQATAKLHSAFWVVISLLLAYYTNFFNVAYSDSRVNRISLYLAALCFLVSMCIMLYLTLWLPLIAKITIPWEVYCPKMIPISTAMGVSCYILLQIAFWPIWGFLTPIIVTVLLFGFLFSSHFIPWPC